MCFKIKTKGGYYMENKKEPLKKIAEGTGKEMALKLLTPSAYLAESIIKSILNLDELKESSSVDERENELARQEHKAKIKSLLAKIAQETAIAARIENAKEVTIEELYSDDLEGKAGMYVTNENISIGLSGSGKTLTKRIYTFKGNLSDKKQN